MPKTDADYKLEPETKTEVDERIEAKEVPIYMERLELSDEQKKRLKIELQKELDVIKAQRETEHIDQKDAALENQYNGKLREDTRMQFNLNRNITKPVVDRVVSYIKQAFFKSDPIYSVSPRPEFDKQGGREVCDKQQDFLDYKLDNLPFQRPVGQAIHSAALLGTGYVKVPHVIKRMPRKREERYGGVKPIGNTPDGRPVLDDTGLQEFLSNWPDAPKDYPGLLKKLAEGKDINIIATYKDTIYNDPLPQFIKKQNLYIRTTVESYEDLSETRFIGELKNWTWWELQQEEKKDKFYDIEELVKDKDGKEKSNYENEDFDIFECTYYFKVNEDDDEETKIICWWSEDKNVIIGSILYPHDVMYYVPFYISDDHKGLAEFVTDSHIAQSVILNLALGGVYIRNTITPITKDPEVINQFLEKRFVHGIPLEGDPKTIDFVQKYMSQIDIGGLLTLMQFMKQGDEETVSSSSLMSGKETPLDPTAPASKTMALMKMAGIGIEDYIMVISPSFNQLAYILLQIYYQMSTEGRKYKIHPERVVGDNPFGTLERNDMIARTNIEAQAYAYDFDKLEAKREDFALYQILRNEKLIAVNPEAVYFMLRVIIKSWSPKWNNNVDKVLPPLQELKKQQLMTAIQAVQIYVQQKVQDAQATGVPPEFSVKELLPLIVDMQAEIATNPPEEVMKERAKTQEAANAGR